ncbi:MAG: hypothetical protein COU82_00100 [Candidatus Portnoybacteria bacterium CG10_big_fil_rev_8_21_14_0_10_38_18]|uniref:Uncharacterized protein n=1 Tax=Candidatus Portnoybacteria bacterium CG10_big_fil_rev_8_21_14_0_10_38_18 TaxID=1974813 RepID=A0A2M8KCX7_9BACT|nr:MAG: hypothetical protein COU82_00100 [Candidatus Portnoybacteria bacterium CG10_big_fil_rev_8_21_14_0_10_38_18]
MTNSLISFIGFLVPAGLFLRVHSFTKSFCQAFTYNFINPDISPNFYDRDKKGINFPDLILAETDFFNQ